MTTIRHCIPARPASDGAGVKIKRVVPTGDYSVTDPFLMLDEIRSEDGSDYAAGFPAHPHRGFETITYMRQGQLEHQDHMGNRGVISSGGAQWMTAGRGVIHSEMPLQQDGAFHGFQLWLNLPAAEKMRAAEYHNLEPGDIPTVMVGKHLIRVLGGNLTVGTEIISGPIRNRATAPQVWDIEMKGDAPLVLPLDAAMACLLYLYEGKVEVAGEPLREAQLVSLEHRGEITLRTANSARLLLLAGKPLAEPVVQYGPCVMNSRQQIETAIQDYQAGTLVAE